MKAENHKQTKCLNKLKNLLARRAHSEKELKRKLNTFSKTEVEQAIETAKKINGWNHQRKWPLDGKPNWIAKKKDGFIFNLLSKKEVYLPP